MQNLTKLLFAFSFILFLGACNSDNDLSTVEGTWTAVSFDANVVTTSVINGMEFSSTVDIVGSNFDYDLTFTTDAFTTSGGYSIAAEVETNGGSPQSSNEEYSGISGSGTYTATSDVMTINGSFFTFEINGMPYVASSEAQETNYEISDENELIFTQNETFTSTDSGVTSTSVVVSNSKWVRQ